MEGVESNDEGRNALISFVALPRPIVEVRKQRCLNEIYG